MHLTSSAVDWYVARAGGVVAYVLLSAAVVIGLTMSGRRTLKRWPRFAVEDIHRFAGLLTGAFIVLHVAAIAIDSYLPFSLTSLLVPLVSSYRPLWVALGIVAAELLLALAIANRLRNRRLSHKAWRRTHYLNFAVWAAATLHGLGSGTDRSRPWLLAIEGVATALVIGLTVWRVLRVRQPALTVPKAAPVLSAFAGVAVTAALALGPLAFKPKPWNAATFTDSLSGQVLRDTAVTRGIVSLAGNGTGSQRVLVRADLLIAPRKLLSTVFQLEYLPSGLLCLGHITQVHSYGFEAACQLPSGESRFVHAEWTPSQQSSFEGGTLSVHS